MKILKKMMILKDKYVKIIYINDKSVKWGNIN